VIKQAVGAEEWPWECVGTHEGAGFLGPWEARAYVVEHGGGWYASADGRQIGTEYTYRLPGCGAPTGPYTRERAEGLARQMIGLAPDASVPPPDRLVLFLTPGPGARQALDAKDVTGRRWTFTNSNKPQPCSLCNELVNEGWAQGRWGEAPRHICPAHVELRNEARPAERR
jgi:hypothetical protein